MLLPLISFLVLASAQADLSHLREVEVRPILEMTQLLKEQDIDRDLKITIDDLRQKKKIIPRFSLRSVQGTNFSIEGTYFLSNLLQELKQAADLTQDEPVKIRGDHIFENPVSRTSRLIREMFWDSLTRVIDREHLYQVLGDTKVKSANRFLYVPFDDEAAFSYYSKAVKDMPELKIKIVRLPSLITPQYVKSLSGAHGLLALKLNTPYVVPGGRFNEMYGWDSYFEGLGLLVDQRVDLAKAMVDQLVYEIQHYGKILNANRTYYLTRSQPPFLPSFIRAVREALPNNLLTQNWLKESLQAAIQEYETVWMGKDRLTDTGLSRYAGDGLGIPPEVEEGHFNTAIAPFAKKKGLSIQEYAKRYDEGLIKEPKLDDFFSQDRAVRESGHDTTYRWRVGNEDRAADFVTVDLNSLLYKAELEMAHLIERYFDGKFKVGEREWTAGQWRDKAADRKKKMLSLLWDPEQKLFFDYDFIRKRRSRYVSATTLYPLWAWDASRSETRFLNRGDERDWIQKALHLLEKPGGVVATSEISLRTQGDPKHARQWEYPNGWTPHQMLIWIGLEQSGYQSVANRLIYKWLYMITRNVMDYQGTIPEKYDVVKRSHRVFAEYGNVGTDFAYITREGFGWMNASYQVGLQKLSISLRQKLEKPIPPEWILFDEER